MIQLKYVIYYKRFAYLLNNFLSTFVEAKYFEILINQFDLCNSNLRIIIFNGFLGKLIYKIDKND